MGEGASERPTGVKSVPGFAGLGLLTCAASSLPSPASAPREPWVASGLLLPLPLRCPPVLTPHLCVVSERWLAPACTPMSFLLCPVSWPPSPVCQPLTILCSLLTLLALASPHFPSRVLYLLCASLSTNPLEVPPMTLPDNWCSVVPGPPGSFTQACDHLCLPN